MFKKILLSTLISFTFFNCQANIMEKVKELNEQKKIILIDVLYHLETCLVMGEAGEFFLPYPLIEDWETKVFLRKLSAIDNDIMLIVSNFLCDSISEVEKGWNLDSPEVLAFIEGNLKPEKIPDGIILQRGHFYKSFQEIQKGVNDPDLLKALTPKFYFEKLLITAHLVNTLNGFINRIKTTLPPERYK